MRLRAGDLVMVNNLGPDVIQLFNSPPGPVYHDEEPVSWLGKGEPGLVISLDRLDGRCVYLVGPHGNGWTFGAYVSRISL